MSDPEPRKEEEAPLTGSGGDAADREAGQDLVGRPPLPLEIHNVGLHEDRAAITKFGHGLGREGDVGEILHLKAETSGG